MWEDPPWSEQFAAWKRLPLFSGSQRTNSVEDRVELKESRL